VAGVGVSQPDRDEAAVPWICCQIGRREHYAVARALQRAGCLGELITDLWSQPRTLLSSVGGARLRDRYHPDLDSANVWAPNIASLTREGVLRLNAPAAWEGQMERNAAFQRSACDHLRATAARFGRRAVLFAYSYAAREVFALARTLGWTTVLGQIDPGPVEERLVQQLHQRYPTLASQWQPAPARYWENWREECRLADRIVVNSEWSRDALLEEGVAPSAVRIVPVAFDAVPCHRERLAPARYSAERPLRVLILGQVNLRKGVAETLDAARRLADQPVEFTFVGPLQITVPPEWSSHPRVHWVGSVAASELEAYLDAADVLLFATHSDGFGMVQIEALAHGVPVITSTHCARLVVHGVNGLILEDVSGASVAESLLTLLRDPERAVQLAHKAEAPAGSSLREIGRQLIAAAA
jgi:glycosyltransferase involved in cell wall biosynthesis